ncbi:MAG: M18 family aminopeptidase [Myxococcales bacterium]|jgi:aspartyl aminopeptidase
MSQHNQTELARDLLGYVDASPTPYHAVVESARRLEAAGFSRLEEADSWSLQPGGKHYVVRAGSSLAAFVVGERAPAEAGFLIGGAHTDSPNLRIKPRPDITRHGYRQLGVEVYGGVLWHTWLDRDLSIAGRVTVDDGSATGATHLIAFGRPVCRIPNIAIHLERTVNSEGLKLNAQRHLSPLWALDHDGSTTLRPALCLELARGGVQVEPDDIIGWDLCLHDVQPSTIGGHDDSLLLAPRLDNLASCHTLLTALMRAGDEHDATRLIALYDHEEVGSRSAQGAGSPFLQDIMARLAGDAAESLPRAVARSFMISADMAHAVHPNYADKHDGNHRPVIGRGPVIKTHVSQAYASDAETRARFEALCRRSGVTPQHFVSRSDFQCGSTIGPITAGKVGLRTVDVGNPLLSMHSIREMAGVQDVAAMQRVLDTYFE